MIPELNLLGIILLYPVVLAQFDIVQPDVSFTENNDRFDLTEMWQDKKLQDIPLIDEGDSAESGEYRRNLPNDEVEGQLSDILKKKDPSNIFLTRKADGGFGDEDRMDEAEAGTMSDFEENLKHFQINIKAPVRRYLDAEDHHHGYKQYRKNYLNPDGKVLMHYAVPIVMKLDGYLKVPLK